MKTTILSLILLFQIGTAHADPHTLLLSDFLKRTQSQSPEVKIEKAMSEEAGSRSQGLRISPPMVGLMNMKDASGSNKGIEIYQEIPFPTKIMKEKEVRELEANSQNTLFSYRKNEITLEARQAYFDFWKAFESKKVLEEKQAWLKNHVRISRATARSDSTSQIHLLGTESELDLLENEVLEAQTELTEKANALKTFVPDLQTENMTPEAEPKLETIDVDKNSKSSFIASKESELKAAEASKTLKKQSYLPDIVLRYRSFEGNDTTPRNEEMMVGITLPFLFGQSKSEASEASARSQRAEAELQKARLAFDTRLSTLTEKSQTLKKQLMLLKDKLLPRAHKRMKLVENLSARTMEGLDEHRTVMLDYLNLRAREINSRIEYEKTLAEILKLVNKEADL
jgi:outer membrane protein TolC